MLLGEGELPSSPGMHSAHMHGRAAQLQHPITTADTGLPMLQASSEQCPPWAVPPFTCWPVVSSLRKEMDSSSLPRLVRALMQLSRFSKRSSRNSMDLLAFSCSRRAWLPARCSSSGPLARPSSSLITWKQKGRGSWVRMQQDALGNCSQSLAQTCQRALWIGH